MNTVAMSALAHRGGGWRSLLELPR